jgi:PAS domain S-box-containing protein
MIREVNETALNFFGMQLKDLIDQPFWDRAWFDTGQGLESKVYRLIQRAARGEFIRTEFEVKDCNGNLVPVDFSLKPVFNNQGEIKYLIPEGREISKLKEAQKKIESLNISLEHIVRERTASLHETNEELESFNYSVSHDLRAPIRAIASFGELLKLRYKHQLDAEGMEFIRHISNNAQFMGGLIDDLLSFSRFGKTEMDYTDLDVSLMMQQEYDKQAILVKNRNIQLDIQKAPSVEGDPVMIRQVISNVLSNAIKYTLHESTAQIEFKSKDRGNFVEFELKDNGIGFRQQYADKIFGVFKRVHSNEFEGTGVGLAIVKRIIDRHGGEVWADSEVGVGTSLFFTLPKKFSYGSARL